MAVLAPAGDPLHKRWLGLEKHPDMFLVGTGETQVALHEESTAQKPKWM